jgi:hypothetical protein
MNTRRPGSRRLGLWGIILLLPLASCHLSHQLQLNIDVSERQGAQAVPPGFLGLSMVGLQGPLPILRSTASSPCVPGMCTQEPQSAAGYIAAEPVFQQLIKNLAEPWNAGPLNIRYTSTWLCMLQPALSAACVAATPESHTCYIMLADGAETHRTLRQMCSQMRSGRA